MIKIHQIKIEPDSKKALLDLNPYFYSKKAISETALAFKEVCKTTVKTENNRTIVELSPIGSEDCEELAKKFANFALSVSREMP
ncbi:MAG: HxsD-like protein [archaeon]|nr:HxsD-like protein [archaeon]